MANLAGVFKEEIRRLARKEIKVELAATKKAAAQQRKDIAALKRQFRDQHKKITSLEKVNGRAQPAVPAASESRARFSPKWIQAHRKRLQISAEDYATLTGVSALTVYNWEKGKSRPQAKQLEKWLGIRGMNRREAWQKLGYA